MYFECVPDIKKQKIDGRQMGKLGDTIESINYGLDLFLFLCRCRLNSYSPVFRTIKIINFNLKKICDVLETCFDSSSVIFRNRTMYAIARKVLN